jgi:exo-beta-1,3-glucanase (GH17 family)
MFTIAKDLKILLSMTLLTSAINSIAHTKSQQEKSNGSIVNVCGNHRDGFYLQRNEELFKIKGVGGQTNLELLADLGGNSIRTWGIGEDTEEILDRAQNAGISVTLGIWVGHERHGFDYRDKDDLNKQRQQITAAIEKFKNHPALLCWGLGNEMEGVIGEGSDQIIWREINHLATLIKGIDSNHPIMSVVANINASKIKAIKKYAPAVDILGINAYAGASELKSKIRSYDWEKPYVLTEFGPPGPWEVDHTEWEAPIEPSSRDKMSHYYASYQDVAEDTQQCLGSYAFLWGNKQEATASWFGMLLEDGSKLPVADTMSFLWNGAWPDNRSPLLDHVEIPFANKRNKAKKSFSVKATYKDPDFDSLSYEWTLFKESEDRKIGGDKEHAPEEFKECIIETKSKGRATIQTPSQKGAYRLYLTVRDGKGGAAIDNWPFYVK